MKGIIWTKQPIQSTESKIATVLKDYKYISKRYGVILMLAVFVMLGLIVGAVVSQNVDENTLKVLDFLFLTDYKARLEISLFSVFVASISAYFVFYLIQILMGFSAWGFIFMPITTFLKGFGTGISAGYLASTLSFTGVGFYILVMLPATVVSIISLLIQGKESFYLSKNILKLLIRRKEENFKSSSFSLSKFFTISANMLILVALSAGIDVLTTLCFSNLFSF